MKEEKKRTANDWALLAKTYGEECIKIQRNTEFSVDQKIKKQSELSDILVGQINNDSHLTAQEKDEMARSVILYLNEWKKLADILKMNDSDKTCSSGKSGSACCCKH